jgi:hypothetical protein
MMSLKKNLIIGQVALEYFILFSLIALITLLSLSSFHQRLKDSLQGTPDVKGFFQNAVDRMRTK